jgi:hypothetical protein
MADSRASWRNGKSRVEVEERALSHPKSLGDTAVVSPFLGWLFLLPETPAPMCYVQFGDILGIERNVRVAAHRRYQRTVRNRNVFKDATVL